MTHQNDAVAGTQCPRGRDVFLITHREHGAASNAGKDGRIDQADGDHGVGDALAQRGQDGDGQQNGREGKEDVHGPHDDFVQPTARGIAGDQTEQGAQGPGDAHGNDAHQQRNPGPIHDAAKGIPAEIIGTKGMAQRGGGEAIVKIDGIRIVRAQQWSEDGHDHQQQHNDGADATNGMLE